jgi:hypothetical protein
MRAVFLTALVGWTAWVLQTTQARAAEVVINEVMADNRSAVANAGQYNDWIELYNQSDQYVNLGGMGLTDELLIPGKFTFPPNTWIAPRGFLPVWCDNANNLPGLHTGFALSAEGQTVALFTSGFVPQMLDAVSFGSQLPDLTIGRVPDGSGAWQLTKPTFAMQNAAQALGSPRQLKVNEWMASPLAGSDWFELYNPEPLPVALGGLFLSDSASAPVYPAIQAYTFIGPGGFLVFQADGAPTKGSTHANFKLSASGENITVFSADLMVLESVRFPPQDQGVSQGRLPDGAPNMKLFTSTASPGDSNYLPLNSVVINEVLSHTDPPIEDAIELYNPTSTAVDMSGWYISNQKSQPRKFRIPDGTVIPAGGYHVFYEYEFCPDPALPTSFTLNSAHGDEVHVFATTGESLTGHRADAKFGAALWGASLGRYVTPTVDDFTVLSRPSFGVDTPTSVGDFRRGTGLPNALPKVGPVVINEIMFHPPDIIFGGVTNDNVLDEYIELHNITTTAVPLYDAFFPLNTWRLANGVEYVFPPNIQLAPKGYILAVSFDPATNDLALASFKAKYGLGDDVRIFGPYRGRLDNGGETIELEMPDKPQAPPHPDAGFVPYVQVDRVRYSDALPWPTVADGLGPSLQRRQPSAYGNDPANWFADTPTPGQPNGILEIQSVRLEGATVVLQMVTAPLRSYTVQYRDSLSSGNWLKLKDIPMDWIAQTVRVTDTLASPTQQRFFRVVSPATP